MRELNTRTEIADLYDGPDDDTPGDFDPASVFADPVAYLDRLGLRSELVGTRVRHLPTAA